jgi:hypothetical protein
MVQWRPGRGVVAGAIVAAALLLVAAWVLDSCGDPSGVDGSDPGTVGVAFVRRYARHDPAVCELVTSALRGRLQSEGRCAGPVRGTVPQVGVFSSRTCDGVHHLEVMVAPEGEFGRRFVSVGLEQAGATWLVRSSVPVADCRVLTIPACGSGG